jgi:hypothetical protein
MRLGGRRMRRPWQAVVAMFGIAATALTPVPASADEVAYAWQQVAVQPPPATMHPGQIVTLSAAIRNTGTATWFTEDLSTTPMRLGAAAPRDRASSFALQDPTWLWSGGKRIRMSSPVVAPGSVGTFTFTFRAPTSATYPRAYTESFAPVVDGHWLDESLLSFTTRVVPASGSVPPIDPPPAVPSPEPVPSPTVPTPPVPANEWDWEPVAITPVPAAMHPGSKHVVTVSLRNTGSKAWEAEELSSTPMRLAAVNPIGVTPRHRASEFGRDDPSWIWSGGTRIRMTTPFVESGSVGVFTFTITAPTLASYPRTYVERFAPIVEGVALLDDQLISFTTQIRPAASAVPAVPEIPTVPSPSPLPTPEPLPTLPPVPTPTPEPLPTVPPVPGVQCPTTANPRAQDISPAIAMRYGQPTRMLPGVAGSPSGVAFGFGKLFVSDPANDRIIKTDPAGFAVETFGAPGSGAGQLNNPSGIALSDSAVVFVADTGNDRISVFGFAGIYLSSFGGTGDAPGKFRSPTGISMIANGPFAGNLAIADTGNDRVQIVSRTGTPIAVIGSSGVGVGEFSSPSSVSVWNDALFVADTGNQRIQRFLIQDGLITTSGGWGGEGSDAACTSLPTAVVATAYGVFVAEAGTNRIEHFTRWGSWLETIDGPQFPTGIALDPSARMFVSEGGADRVLRLTPTVAFAPPVG